MGTGPVVLHRTRKVTSSRRRSPRTFVIAAHFPANASANGRLSANKNCLRYNLSLLDEHRDFTIDLLRLGMGSPTRPRLVCRPLWHADRAATIGVAEHSGAENHACLGSHGLRQNAGRISHLHRSLDPQGDQRGIDRPDRSPICLAAQSAKQRHSEKLGNSPR